MKIANKISLSFFAVALVLTAMFGYVSLKITENALKQEITARLETTARSREEHVETYLKLIKASVAQLSKSVVLENFLRTAKDDPQWDKAFEDAMTRLKRTKNANPAIYEFLVLDATGRVVVSSNGESIGQARSTDAIFLEGRKGIHVKDAYYSDVVNEPLIAVSAPLVSRDAEQFIGVLAARITLGDLNVITTERTGLGRTGEIYIVNQNGYMITPSRLLKDTFLKQRVDTENFRLCMKRGAETENTLKTIICPDYHGVKALGTSAYIAEMKWALLAEIDLDEAFTPLQRLRFAIILVLILIPPVAWLLGIAVSTIITRPLHRLHKGTEIIGTGDLDYKVGTAAQDEVGQLSRAFDAMTTDLKKKIVSIDKLNREMAEREKAEAALTVSEQKARAIFDQTFEFIGLMTPDGILIEANRAALAFAGVEASSVLDKPFWQTPWWAHSPQLKEQLKETVKKAAGGEFIRFEATHTSRDGVLHYVDFSLKPVKDKSGRVIFLIPEGRDITEQKKLQEELAQSQTMVALGRFSAGAAHEIKNPLGIILGGMEYLRVKFRDADEKSKETIGMISDAVFRVDAIINALVGLTGPSKHTVRKINIKTLVDKTVLLLKPKLKDRQITLNIRSIAEGLFVEVDIDQIEYALLSILMNAVDAMPADGEVKIAVSKELSAASGQGAPKCVIEIADKGEGISEENLPKIFEPFFTTRRDKKQIGLGLAISKAFVNINKGNIVMTSEKEKGTIAKITLPLAE